MLLMDLLLLLLLFMLALLPLTSQELPLITGPAYITLASAAWSRRVSSPGSRSTIYSLLHALLALRLTLPFPFSGFLELLLVTWCGVDPRPISCMHVKGDAYGSFGDA